MEGKAFNPETDTMIEISYSEAGFDGQITETITLTEVYLTGLQVTTNPSKTAYRHGEKISYDGMVVTANYSDGSSSVVTNKCRITPSKGKAFDAETDTYVEIIYSENGNEMSCMLTLTPILMTALRITSNPTKTAYMNGERIDYSGIVVTAIYSDATTSEVTENCTFTPPAGKIFNSDTSVTITYLEGESEQSCTLNLTEISMSLVVDKMPTKTSYKPDETIDYTGAVIKAVHLDGTQHTVTDYCEFSSSATETEINVTVKCAPPMTPYAFDHNSGYVDNGTWKNDNQAYTDIYEVKAGHKYLLTLDSTVGSQFKAMFTTTDVSNVSANVSGTKIINTDNPAAYASVSYTPSSRVM